MHGRRAQGRTMRRMGLSSSMSMGTLVLWIQVLVQRWRSRTYEFLQTAPRLGERTQQSPSRSRTGPSTAHN